MLKKGIKSSAWIVSGIVLGVFMVSQTFAQAPGWSCRIHLPPNPYSFHKEDLEKLMWIDVKNKEKGSVSVYLHGEITKDGKLIARANSNRIEIPKGGKRITRGDITKLSDEWWDKKLEKQLIRVPILPEGKYEACVYVYKWGTKELLTKCCTSFESKPIAPPRLISPKNGATIKEKHPLFQWIPPQPTPPKVTYDLKIVEISKGETKGRAIKKPAFYEKKGIKRTSFKYPTSARAFKKGRKYAWQITVFSGRIEIGKSEVWEFTVKMSRSEMPPKAGGMEIYFADAGKVPGSVYRYNIATHSETKIYTRPAKRLYSFLFVPWDPNKLYFVNANEHKIYQKDISAGAPPESTVYTHTTYVRDIAIPEDGLIYFSEATGAGGDGKIYRLEKDGTVTLFYQVKLATVDGFWGGDFTFDKDGTLYLSTGNRVGASIYRVDVAADVVTKVYTAPGECIKGMTFGKDGLLYYADWRTKIYCLDLATGHRSIVYNNPSRKWLSDVGFKPIEPSVDPPPGITTWVMPYGVGGTSLDRIDTLGLTSYGSVDSAPFGGYLGFRHGSASSIPTTDIRYYRWLYKHDSIPGWNEFTIPVVVHYVKECPGFLPVFPTYRLGPDNIGGKQLYQFKPHEPPSVPGCTTYWPTSGFLGDIYSGFLNSAGAHLPPGRYKIKLEIYDSNGVQKMPGDGFQFIVPTSEDPDGTIHTRKALPSEIEGGGFTFALHIDNRPCSAYIAAPEIGGVGASDTCGFLRFDPADTTPVHIAFHASHPDGFARFSFKIVRGIEIAESTFVAYPNVFATSAGVYTGDGSGNFEHDFSRATLLGPCTEAAFSENLYVYAKATRGWGHRISALDASFVRAFALAEQKEE